jgi:hypothetical protein
MGILDDAIREHLDLKRRHGAREAELREIEDEALGSGEEPDPFAAGGELLGEVSATGTAQASREAGSAGGPSALSEPSNGGDEPTRLVEPEALRRSPQESELPEVEELASRPEGVTPLPGQTELPGQDEVPGQERLDEPIEDLPSLESEEPSESLEDLIAEEEPFPEDSAAPPPDTSEAEEIEPQEIEPQEIEPEETSASVPEPPPPPPPGPEPPGRARGRIDVPTQEHPPPGDTGGAPAVQPPEQTAEPEPEPLDGGDGPALYDFETDEDSLTYTPPADTDDDFEALGPPDEEASYLDEEEPYAEEPSSGAAAPPDEPGTEVRPAVEDEDEEAYGGDALEAEESYEGDTDDDLWFEKGPPKDFDFDD